MFRPGHRVAQLPLSPQSRVVWGSPCPALAAWHRSAGSEESSKDLASVPDTSRRLTGPRSSTCAVQCDYNPQIQIY